MDMLQVKQLLPWVSWIFCTLNIKPEAMTLYIYIKQCNELQPTPRAIKFSPPSSQKPLYLLKQGKYE